jgi:pimeloyl-ACP methyl ester carboxylesterase
MSERTDIPAERNILRNMIPVGLAAPDWSLWDIYWSLQASDYAEDATFAADASYDARKFATDIRIPFFIINGELDHVTPTDLAKPYFDEVHAPLKQFVVLNGAGHSAVLTEPDVFLHELVMRVRPAAMAAGDER